MNRWWNRVPARTRLTVWFSALLAAMILTLGIIALWLVEFALTSNGDELLMDKASAIAAETDVAHNRLTFDSSEVPLIAGLEVVRIWDHDRKVIFDQEGARDLGVPGADTIDSWLAGAEEFSGVRDASGAPIRLYAQPIRQRDRIIGALQIGRAQTDQEAVLGRLRAFGLVVLILAVALAWLGGHWLAGRMLRPIATITSEAERIDAEALSRRLALTSADDELRRLALAFNGMIERLDAAFAQQKQFTADASHELRTPLAVLRSEIEVALAHPRSTSYDTAVYQRLVDETLGLTRIVENLFALARADSGATLTLAPVDIQELVADAGARFAPRAQAHSIRFEMMLDDAPHVAADALWLNQLLVNLLENALRHCSSGDTIAVALHASGEALELGVSDTGDGIAPEHLPHIFERFYRVDDARGRATGGAGLGLAICDWIARAHGATLTVASELGQGTTVTLRLLALAPEVATTHRRLQLAV